MRLIGLLLFVITSTQLTATEKPGLKRIFNSTELQGIPPVIDGILDDTAWENSNWEGNFVQQTPTEKGVPTQETRVSITYDQDNLYVGIICFDEPDKIRRIFTRRDNFGGDATGFAIDSYHNQRTAYEFNLTAAGQKIDLLHYGNGYQDANWNANWEGATSVSDSGWCAEFRVPFSQLRYNELEDYTWGLHVWRWIDRLKEEDQWYLIPVNSTGGVHNFGELRGIQNIKTTRQTELLPYVSTKFENDGDNDNPYLNDFKFSPNAGLDAKIGISSNLTLDLTVNPDFGQIESDPSELNLSAFETYLQEKRPYFLEGGDIFNYNYNGNRLFYSRRIGASPSYTPDTDDDQYYTAPENTTILSSAKLSGRTAGGLSVGLIETLTNKEYGKLYSPDSSSTNGADNYELEKIQAMPLSNYFSTRLKKQSKSANTIIGGSFNSVIRKLDTEELKDVLVANAHTIGIDFFQHLDNKKYYIIGNGVFSHISGSENAILEKQEAHVHRFQRPDANHIEIDSNKTSLTGSSSLLQIGKASGDFIFRFTGGHWSPELNVNDMGFMKNTDYIEQESLIKYRKTDPKGLFRYYRIFLENTNQWSFGKERIYTNVKTGFVGTFTGLWDIYAEVEKALPALDVRILRGGPALYQDGYAGGHVWLQSNSSKKVYQSAYYNYYGSRINKSKHKGVGTAFNWNPADNIKLSLELEYTKKDYAYEYFDADLTDIYMLGRLKQNILSTTIRLEYYLKPEISFQYYGNPYFSAVRYSKLRRVNNSQSSNANDRFYTLNSSELSFNETDNTHEVSELNGDTYSFENPDVSYGQFQSNFVFRWEYKLGSVFYVVWSHTQSEYENIKSPQLNDPIQELFKNPSGDVLMFKLSYWFNV